MCGEPRGAVRVDADVEGQHDSFRAEFRDPGRDLLRMAGREAADDDAFDAERKHLVRHRAAPDAAADLQGQAGSGSEARDGSAIALRAVARPIEVHDVDEPRPERTVVREYLVRVVGIDGFGVEAALQQSHAAAGTQVDGRNEQHQRRARKLASSRLPTRAERSGWNCTPWKFSWFTTAENSPA